MGFFVSLGFFLGRVSAWLGFLGWFAFLEKGAGRVWMMEGLEEGGLERGVDIGVDFFFFFF